MAVSHFAAPEEPRWETMEEVLAVVGNTPILFSDLELAALVRLVEPEAGEAEAAFRSRLLDARVRLELQFRDLEDGGLLLFDDPADYGSETRRNGEGVVWDRLHQAYGNHQYQRLVPP